MNIFGDDNTFLSVIAEPIVENNFSTIEGNESAPQVGAPYAVDLAPFGDERDFRSVLVEYAPTTQQAPADTAVQAILQSIDDLTRIDTDTLESELPPAFPDDNENVQIADELDDVFETLNQAFVKVNSTDCGKIRIGNDYGAFEIDRKCGAPYARFCPCQPERMPQCGVRKGADSQNCEQGDKAGIDLTDLTDLFSWYWTARESGNCDTGARSHDFDQCANGGNCFRNENCNDNIYNVCPFDIFSNRARKNQCCERGANCERATNCDCAKTCELGANRDCETNCACGTNCDCGAGFEQQRTCYKNFPHCNHPDAWTPKNNCSAPPKPPAKPCAKRLARNIYYRLLQTTQAVDFLIDCAPNAQAHKTLCCVKQNLNTLSLAMLATSKRICGARPIVANALEKPNCPFERGVNAVICELSAIIKEIQLLQTLPTAQCAYGALVVIAFGVNRTLSMMYTL